MSFIDIENEGKPVQHVDIAKAYYDPKVVKLMMENWNATPRYQYTSHLQPAVDIERRAITIEKSLEAASKHDFDTFAFSGISGAAVGFILAHLLNKEIIVVRKPHEYTRAGTYEVQGYRHSKRFMIVDDLVSTGITAGRIIRGVRSIAPQAEVMGILQYLGTPRVTTNNGEDPYMWDSIFRHAKEVEQ